MIGVSIAFRRSVRSRPPGTWDPATEPACLHCLSAFSAFPTSTRNQVTGTPLCLHCLSAFSAFPTVWLAWKHFRGVERLHCLSAFSAFPTRRPSPDPAILGAGSPLPFGVQCVPDCHLTPNASWPTRGLHCLSAFSAFPTRRPTAVTWRLLQRSPLPFGVQCVPD